MQLESDFKKYGTITTKKILFIVSEDWYFMSHRLPLALAAKENGYDVAIATRISNHRDVIELRGLRVIPLEHMNRSSTNIINELKSLFEIFKIIRSEYPTVVHAVAIKSVIYATLCGRILNVPLFVSALGGLGSIFSDDGLKSRLFRPLIKNLFRLLLNGQNSKVILQNQNDINVLTQMCGLQAANVVLVPGAGVDIKHYSEAPFPSGTPVVMLASRMIWPKGIQEFVDAAVILKKKREVRFVLVGRPDPGNPSSIPETVLQKWNDDGIVEWWGYRSDMAEMLSQATLVCLPTYYGEGVPKILLEAMAVGRPIITTDTPGCRELLENGMTGVLVEKKNHVSLAEAVDTLLSHPERLPIMGRKARIKIEAEYGIDRVISQTLRIYTENLPPRLDQRFR